MSILLRSDHRGVIFRIRVVPKADRSEIIGVYGDALKVKINAPPIKGKANNAVVSFLGKLLGVPANKVMIIQGERSKDKTVLVWGKNIEEVREAFYRIGVKDIVGA